MKIKQHNFGAGPCILPPEVLVQASQAVLDWDGIGLSVLEVSHRCPAFEDVLSEAESLVRELLEIPAGYQVLFLQGGASTQFSMLAQSFLRGRGRRKAAYLDTGYFAQKAIAQARHFGEVEVVASGQGSGYGHIPEVKGLDTAFAYLHLTSNNTIEGTEIFDFPSTGVPLVCDMSSDIFSRKLDVSKFGMVYAGAQKNLGPAGMTLVIVREELLQEIRYDLPAMSDYRVHVANRSMYNTPPVFSIYVAMLNLRWLKEQGGITEMEERNKRKSALLYRAVDRSEIFHNVIEERYRSRMNVTFRAKDPAVEEAFLRYVEPLGIVGIKGYKTVGGFRVSLYNALPIESVHHLVDAMDSFESRELDGRRTAKNNIV